MQPFSLRRPRPGRIDASTPTNFEPANLVDLDELPDRFRRHRLKARIGTGHDWYLRARDALLAGTQFELSWVSIEGADRPFQAGQRLTINSRAWPLWISAVLLAMLAHVDVLLLGSHRSDEEVASYGAAARLAAVMLFPYVVANAATAASVAELYAQNRRRDLERVVRRLTSLVFAVTLVLALGFFWAGEALMAGIYGEYYRPAATVLVVLAAGQLAAVASGPGALVLMMTGYERTLMGLTLVTVAVLLGLGSWAAKFYGALGLAVAVATVQALQGIGVMLAARWRTGIWTCVKVA